MDRKKIMASLTKSFENALSIEAKKHVSPRYLATFLVKKKNLRFTKQGLRTTLRELWKFNDYNCDRVWKIVWNMKKQINENKASSWTPHTILIKKNKN